MIFKHVIDGNRINTELEAQKEEILLEKVNLFLIEVMVCLTQMIGLIMVIFTSSEHSPPE